MYSCLYHSLYYAGHVFRLMYGPTRGFLLVFCGCNLGGFSLSLVGVMCKVAGVNEGRWGWLWRVMGCD